MLREQYEYFLIAGVDFLFFPAVSTAAALQGAAYGLWRDCLRVSNTLQAWNLTHPLVAEARRVALVAYDELEAAGVLSDVEVF